MFSPPRDALSPRRLCLAFLFSNSARVASRRFLTPARAASSYNEALLSTPETKVTTLANGLRIATEQTFHKTATVGVYIDAGSRFETEANNGTAHFLEHMAFKGTKNKSQGELELQVENMGSLLNAYTSREQTVYYSKCFSKDVGANVEILSNLIMNPTLDKAAIESERGVILREMAEIDSMPEEVVLDHLHATAYQGTSLGYTILGSKENILSIQQSDLQQYIDTNYTAPRIVLAAAGGVDHDEVVEMAEKHFGSLSSERHAAPLTKAFTGSEIRARDDLMPEGHVVLAVEGVGWDHDDYFPLMVANSIVGSWDRSFGGGANMASTLARNCATEGFAQKYLSFHTSYSDTGLWGCYGVCDPMAVEDFVWELQVEWNRIAAAASNSEVERAKNQLKASSLFAIDGTTAVCDEIGRQMLMYGRRMYAAELDARISRVTADCVKRVMNTYVYDRCPAVVGLGAIEGLTDYNRVRGNMSWMRN